MHGMIPEFPYRLRHKVFVPVFADYLELLFGKVVGAYLLQPFDIAEQLPGVDHISVHIAEVVDKYVAPILETVEVDQPLAGGDVGVR